MFSEHWQSCWTRRDDDLGDVVVGWMYFPQQHGLFSGKACMSAGHFRLV